MNRRQYIVALFFFSMLVSYGQSNRRVMHGKILNDSLSIERVHVINKTTQKGTLTNKLGDFSIPVKVNDTLIFSAVQFENYMRIVSEADVRRMQVLIPLKPRVNLLDEVVIEPISVAQQLNLPNAHKKPKTKLDARLDGHSKASVPVVLLTTLIGGAGGIDNLYYVLSGQRKKDRKLKTLIQEDRLASINQKVARNIRLYFEDSFFTNSLKIPEDQIDDFIDYCLEYDIVYFYQEERYLELIEVFFEVKEAYLQLPKE